MARLQKPQLRSQKLVRRKRIIRGWKIAAAVLVIGLATWGLSELSKIRQLAIENIVVEGNSLIATEDITTVVNKKLAGNYLGLFSRSNIFLYPNSAIAAAVLAQSKRIEAVSVERLLWHTIVVKVTERSPLAVWCGPAIGASLMGNATGGLGTSTATTSMVTVNVRDVLQRSTSENCGLFDTSGYIFAPAPEFSGATYIRVYGPISRATTTAGMAATTTSSVGIGAQLLTEQGVADAFKIVTALQGQNIDPIAVFITDTEYQIYLKNYTKVLINLDDTAEEVLSVLDSLLEKNDFAQSKKRDFSDMDHIDLRFGKKVFYKLKTGAEITATTSAR